MSMKWPWRKRGEEQVDEWVDLSAEIVRLNGRDATSIMMTLALEGSTVAVIPQGDGWQVSVFNGPHEGVYWGRTQAEAFRKAAS